MFMPSLVRKNNNLFDDLFDDFDRQFDGFNNFRELDFRHDLMRTDIKENKEGFELKIDLPGVDKEDVKAELKDGYLTVTATHNKENDEKDKEGKYIRRERFFGTTSRSYYVGEDLTQEDIKAKFEKGTLTIAVPKKEAKPELPENKYIEIQ